MCRRCWSLRIEPGGARCRMSERDQLTQLYHKLREQELSHDAAIRMLLARVFVTPAFLYRGEHAQPGHGRDTGE